ncbi:phosphopantetheine adenylyltransferase [Nocardia sp. CS682]|uniref:phosphopantetheine adenylyltransferase n=1 Tax=Nocardia sp. CS682 TaxID=1047172 RepID=UPI0010752F7E|nr:phosphopantetheine adenylyltransferase [Nocardia sp. CS682]QBS44287.1 phosphopantetheine adenylyltransferase [Nocardia sp. CS682]
MRRHVGLALLAVAGLLNSAPAVGAVAPQGMYAAYGIAPAGRDLEVVLRHRAVLFAVLGVGLLVAVFRPALRPIAVRANAISMGSFLVLVVAGGPVGPGLVRVAAVDVAGLVALGVGVALLRGERAAEQVRSVGARR